MISQGYEQRLQGLVENIPGALYAGLTGTDGIGIAFYQGGLQIDPVLADAEFATMLTAANRAVKNLAVGNIAEMTVATDKIIILIKMVGSDFYLSAGLGPGTGNIGMARLQMRRASDEFNKVLY